ncbi:MAG TPA: Crp/Fnr family transcriptional regulator [Pyrinomonadaceae bacterium]|jgi:CRP-like cAMP-binding protein
MTDIYRNTDDETRKGARDGQRGFNSAPGFRQFPARAAGPLVGSRKLEGVSLNGLLANRLLSALPADEFASLLSHLEPVSLIAGEELYKLDEEIGFVYFPETAVISHLHFLSDGGMTEAALVGREGMIGLSAVFNSPPPSYVTQVALAGNALRVRAAIFRHLFALGGSIRQTILGYAGARMAQLSQRVVCNVNHRLDERLCTWLLMVHDRAGEDLLALTHEQIARHLGARRAGVTEAACVLRQKNIIENARGQIRVIDRQLLELSACECYPSVRVKFDAVP